MAYSISPYGPLNKLSEASQRKLDLFNFMLNGKDSSTVVDADLRQLTLEKLLERDSSAIAKISADVSEKVVNFLQQQIRDGKTIEQAMEALNAADSAGHGPLALERRNASLIARTEIAYAKQQAILNYYSSWQQHFQYFVWLSVMGPNTCPECSERHNTYRKLENWDEMPPLHPGCSCSLVPGYALPDGVLTDYWKDE